MSMDKSAIVQIQESSHIAEMLQQAEGHQSTLAVLPENYRFHNLEKYQEHRDRFRGSFSTDCIADYVDYSKKHDDEGVRCFIDKDSMSAKTIFDLGTVDAPLHCEHRSSLQLKKTAAFKDLLRHEAEDLNQRQLVAFLEDWHEIMSATDVHGEDMAMVAAIESVRTITIETARSVESVHEDFAEHMSAAEKIEAKNKGNQVKAFTFNCVPYDGLKDRAIELRLSINTCGQRPSMKLRIVGKEAMEEEIAIEFKDLLKGELADTKIETFIGNFS